MIATFAKTRAARPFADRLSAVEGLTLAMAAAVLSLGLGMGVGEMMGRQGLQADAEIDLRALVAEAGYDASVCPNGWAAAHAPRVGLTEAEVTAWYLRESVARSDGEVARDVAAWLRAPEDFRRIEGPALTRTQILLCVAESRKMI